MAASQSMKTLLNETFTSGLYKLDIGLRFSEFGIKMP